MTQSSQLIQVDNPDFIINNINMSHIISLSLPNQLHQRLLEAAKKQNKSLSQFARDIFTATLEQKDTQKIKHMYQVFKKSQGSAKGGGKTFGAQSIDEILYGESGIWRGSDPE